MANMLDALSDTVKSKEYKALLKCSEKSCSNYHAILQKEMELVQKMEELKAAMQPQNIKNLDDMTKKAMELLRLQKEFYKLNTKKDSLLCAIGKCSKEFVDATTIKNSMMEKAFEKEEKKLEAFTMAKKA